MSAKYAFSHVGLRARVMDFRFSYFDRSFWALASIFRDLRSVA
jgi:hypothetical protein